jgi:hypothetical protein
VVFPPLDDPYALDRPMPYSLEGESLEGQSLETLGRSGHGLEMGGHGLEGKSIESASLEGRSLEGGSLEGLSLENTPRVERVRKRLVKDSSDTAVMPARHPDSLVSVHPDRVISGIIWHQILSPPRSKRYLRRYARRTSSVPQSR